MAGKKGIYSNIIIYDERRRYYYLWPQRGKPFLDDEIRDMGIGLLDQIRRSVQNTFGDVAVPNSDYSGFVSTVDAFKVEESTSPVNNFLLKGGTSLDHPAVLYAKGFYIFLTEDVEYKYQMYGSDNIDLNTETQKDLTLTGIPALTIPSADRIDIVYAHLHFEEVSSLQGTDSDVYRDSNLKNPIVGTDTANRLRAVFDIRVREGWTDAIDENIFTHAEFLGGISGNDFDPTDNNYKIPIAAIYRAAHDSQIRAGGIVDLLTLYNKRVHTLEELTYRTRHGGYTQADVNELSMTGGHGFTGFTPQFPGAIVDESAFATGLNKGLGTEAFNTHSVTPRVLDIDGKYFMDALMVGHDTGIIGYETGPEALNDGEIVAKEESLRSLYVGYGLPGITGARGYTDKVNIVDAGVSGSNLLKVSNQGGETGSVTARMQAVQGGVLQNFFHMDYRGRIGLNTFIPGWIGPAPEWNTDRYNDGLFGATGVNILLDIAGSQRISDHLFVDKDAYVYGDMFGRTWKIPSLVSQTTPALFGYTGIPQTRPVPQSISTVLFRKGIVVIGESGMPGYGYTGAIAGQYESYDEEGNRIFTIGDLGEQFDRTVKTLYGADIRPCFLSNYSFLMLPGGFNAVTVGDVLNYDLELATGDHVTGIMTFTGISPVSAAEQIREDILDNPGFPNGYSRTYGYLFHETDGSTTLETGIAYGVQILSDLYGYSLGFDNNDRIILKDMPEDPVDVELRAISQFHLQRGITGIDIPFTHMHCFGSVQYGGDDLALRFAKLDLGEGADGWLFNGDVFFNGNGLLNRVTFSPNVMFRNDVYMYGTLFADQLVFNFADVSNLLVRNLLVAEKAAYVGKTLAIGDNANIDMATLLSTDPDLSLYNKGKAQSRSLTLDSEDMTAEKFGDLYFMSKTNSHKAYARIGGIINSTTDPFGIHLIDVRSGVALDTDNSFRKIILDYSDGSGNYGNVELDVKGDMILDRGLVSRFVSVGNVSAINTDYAFYCNGRAQINDTLEVKALRFIGAEAPEGLTDISTPQNIAVINDGKDTTYNNEIILRNKNFTVTEAVYLENKYILGYDNDWSYTGIYNYYTAMQTDRPNGGLWGHDTLSYTEDQFNHLVSVGDPGATSTVLTIPSITTTDYKRLAFNRITVATLGTLHITWSGFAYDPNFSRQTSQIQSYTFDSPYFRNRNRGTTIDWMNISGRFDENFIVRVTGDIIDSHPTAPNMYSIDEAIGIYIPKDAWKEYGPYSATNPSYRSFIVFYPIEAAINKLNIADFTNKGIPGGYGTDNWQIGLYPRLVTQTKIIPDTPTVGNLERIYQGDWDLDLVIFPPNTGRCANLIGKLYISYIQS